MRNSRSLHRARATIVIVAILAAVATADAAALSNPAATEVHVSVSCLNDRGRIDVQIINHSESRQSYQLAVDRERRYTSINGRGFDRITVTNEFDPEVHVGLVSVEDDGEVEVFSEVFALGCASPSSAAVSSPEITAVHGCGADGLVEVRLTNPTGSPQSFIIELTDADGQTFRSSTTTAAYGVAFRRVSGLADGGHTVTVLSPRRGMIETREVEIDCGRPLSVRANNIIDNDANGPGTIVVLTADGNPTIAYTGNSTTVQLSYGSPVPSDVQLVSCGDPACQYVGPTSVLLTGDIADSGVQQSYYPIDLELGPGGNPVLLYSYYKGIPHDGVDESHTGIIVCNDPTCSGEDETFTVFDGDFDAKSIVEIRPDGRPLLRGNTSDDGSSHVVVSCRDRGCAEVDVSPLVAEGQNPADPENPAWLSALLARFMPADAQVMGATVDDQGHLAIMYRKRSGTVAERQLTLIRCNDVACLGGDELSVPITEIGEYYFSDSMRLLIGPGDRPLIVGAGREGTWITTCADSICSEQVQRSLRSPTAYLSTVVFDDHGAPLFITVDSDTETYWNIVATKCVDFDCRANGSPAPVRPAVDVAASCLGGKGRVDVYVTNTTSSPVNVALDFGRLSRRGATIATGDFERFSITGRPNGPHLFTITAEGVDEDAPVARPVDIDCDSPGASEATAPWTVVTGCRDRAGVIELFATSPEARSFVLESAELGNRSTSTAANGLARFVVRDLGDGTYPLAIRGTGLVAEPTITCG